MLVTLLNWLDHMYRNVWADCLCGRCLVQMLGSVVHCWASPGVFANIRDVMELFQDVLYIVYRGEKWKCVLDLIGKSALDELSPCFYLQRISPSRVKSVHQLCSTSIPMHLLEALPLRPSMMQRTKRNSNQGFSIHTPSVLVGFVVG